MFDQSQFPVPVRRILHYKITNFCHVVISNYNIDIFSAI